ncbi:Ig-like domain-containing protein [Aquimarina agarivorans]|uniref:Ig-like domain-containing protein n=1 Tax=Aquimarina agarivorans TaxID=980584 RepID=UPI000248FDB4|nr:Ig-like domain-containing protein [Aquimarina agarivorans]
MRRKIIYSLLLIWGCFLGASNALNAQDCNDGGNYWKESWKSCRMTTNPNPDREDSYWILYEFEEPIGIENIHIWNANRNGESTQGAKEVFIDISKDGTIWKQVNEDPFEWPKADESSEYEGFEGPDLTKFGFVKKVLFTIKSNHGGDCVSIAEIKFNVDLDACEGVVDECDVCDGPGKLTFYLDADGDGKGNKNTFVQVCEAAPSGYVSNNDDDCDTGGWDQVGEILATNNCTGCHNETGAGGLNLKTYQGFLSGGNKCGNQILSGKTLANIINTSNYDGCGETIQGLSMNERVGGAIDDFEMAVIQAWIDAGAPENDDCNITNTTVINFTNLTDGDEFDEGVDIQVDATILDTDGIATAELFLNDFLLGVDEFPYQWGTSENEAPLLNNMLAGSYTLKIVATDNRGNIAEEAITIVVNEPVIVDSETNIVFDTITDGQEFDFGVSLEVGVTVQDDNGLESVSLFLNDVLLGKDDFPYLWGGADRNDLPLQNMQAGNYELKVVSLDALGYTSEKSISIVVKIAETPIVEDPVEEEPVEEEVPVEDEVTTITFLNLTDGDTFDFETNLQVATEVTDVDGLSSVDLYLNDQLIRQLTATPFEWGAEEGIDPLLDNLESGTYVLKIVATDVNEVVTEKSISITVNEKEEAITRIPVIDLAIDPNPVGDSFSLLKINEVSVNQISIYNIDGRLMLLLDKEEEMQKAINVAQMESGLYILIATTINNNVIVKKFVKK